MLFSSQFNLGFLNCVDVGIYLTIYTAHTMDPKSMMWDQKSMMWDFFFPFSLQIFPYPKTLPTLNSTWKSNRQLGQQAHNHQTYYNQNIQGSSELVQVLVYIQLRMSEEKVGDVYMMVSVSTARVPKSSFVVAALAASFALGLQQL